MVPGRSSAGLHDRAGPGLGEPVNCADVKPLKREITVGALRKLVVVSAETGTIWLLLPRT